MRNVIGQRIKFGIENMCVHNAETKRIAIRPRASGATDANVPIRATDVLDDQASGEVGIDAAEALKRAYERDPAALEEWKRDTYPSIAGRAKRRGVEIYLWDESGFRADVVQGTTWGVRGQTPVIRVPGQRQSVSAASAVNARGGFWFATYKGRMNSGLFIEMLKILMHRRRKPLILILDSLPAHKEKAVKDYVESTNGKLELHFLPGYAPELNPDELVWNYMKRTGTARSPVAKGESLHQRIDEEVGMRPPTAPACPKAPASRISQRERSRAGPKTPSHPPRR
jgi:transposase